LLVGENLNVTAPGLQKIGRMFRQSADQNIKVSILEEVRSMAAVGDSALVGGCQNQRLVALEQVEN